ncbi:MAG: hypothetical protein JXB06_13645, partial [Spirochaetales bacterium]|nr:hypothetical protein [Spirochaetales bacterium]
EKRLGWRDDFVGDIQNHNLYHLLSRPGEGSDFQTRLGPVQRYVSEDHPERSHWHQGHARFYCSPLLEAGMQISEISSGGQNREFFLFPASVHYEVATEEPLHPYEDSCPFCGITGKYAVPVDPDSQDYCLKIHDPLGLELLLHGTIRGRRVSLQNGSTVPSLSDLQDSCACKFEEFAPQRLEPRRLAVVFFMSNKPTL